MIRGYLRITCDMPSCMTSWEGAPQHANWLPNGWRRIALDRIAKPKQTEDDVTEDDDGPEITESVACSVCVKHLARSNRFDEY